MARIARVVVENLPHHVIQRGNRRQKVFFADADKQAYLKILKEQSEKFGVKYWAYCLMDNHVHLIAVPSAKESLAKAIGETHRRYTRMINFRKGWRGYLWQGRFSSFVLDPTYLYFAVRYVERNPVRAGLVKRAEEFDYSSAKAHVKRQRDPILSDFYLTRDIKDWRKYLIKADDQERVRIFHKHMATGRPFGNECFIEKIEKKLGRILQKQKPGPKLKR